MAKVTKREMFEVVREIVAASGDSRIEEVSAFIDHEVELLTRKSGKSSLTATQKANLVVKDTIREVLRDMGKPVTISEMITDSRLAGMSNQKISALVNRMADVVKTTEKKKSFFSLAE